MSVFMLAKFTNVLFEYADSGVRYQLLHLAFTNNYKSNQECVDNKVAKYERYVNAGIIGGRK